MVDRGKRMSLLLRVDDNSFKVGRLKANISETFCLFNERHFGQRRTSSGTGERDIKVSSLVCSV